MDFTEMIKNAKSKISGLEDQMNNIKKDNINYIKTDVVPIYVQLLKSHNEATKMLLELIAADSLETKYK